MSGRKEWDPDGTKAAVRAIKEKGNGEFQGFPRFQNASKTLERYVKLESNSANRIETKLGRKHVLPPSLEDELAEHSLNV
jgi:hypothetical protein